MGTPQPPLQTKDPDAPNSASDTFVTRLHNTVAAWQAGRSSVGRAFVKQRESAFDS